jgi:hypothetical protein
VCVGGGGEAGEGEQATPGGGGEPLQIPFPNFGQLQSSRPPCVTKNSHGSCRGRSCVSVCGCCVDSVSE